jgi:hypothetical protein
LPFCAIGERSILRSSIVYPKASCRSKRFDSSGRPSGVASGRSLRWISPSRSHFLYGCRLNNGLLTSSSCNSSCRSVSTTSIRPGRSLHRSTTSSAGMRNAPSSEAMTTLPSFVTE